MQKKALIIYSSLSGNTEEIVQVFKQAFEKYGWEAVLQKITARTKFPEDKVYFDDFDIVCMGSPILAGLPYSKLSEYLGLYKPESGQFFRGDRFGSPELCSDKRGILFTTYAGGMSGPQECMATLEVLKIYMDLQCIPTVGYFACPGREVRHTAVDGLANALGILVDEAATYVMTYVSDPDNPVFSDFDEEKMRLLREAAADERHFGHDVMVYTTIDGKEMLGSTQWHYDLMNRPNERDKQNAFNFISNIIEDYYLTLDGKPRPASGVYYSIN